MSAASMLFLVAAGMGAGVANAAAGGGTLVAYPALVATGLPPVLANMTSTAGLLPGYAGGSLAYRREIGTQRFRLPGLATAAIAGGVAGAVTLEATPPGVFKVSAPYMVLAACGLLAGQPPLNRWLAARRARMGARAAGPATGEADHSRTAIWLTTAACSLYGSYFGAGLGVTLLAALGLVLAADLQQVNALKTAVSFLANGAGLAFFAATASIAWTSAVLLAVGAFIGGHLGGVLARRLAAPVLRGAVVAVGVVVALLLIVW